MPTWPGEGELGTRISAAVVGRRGVDVPGNGGVAGAELNEGAEGDGPGGNGGKIGVGSVVPKRSSSSVAAGVEMISVESMRSVAPGPRGTAEGRTEGRGRAEEDEDAAGPGAAAAETSPTKVSLTRSVNAATPLEKEPSDEEVERRGPPPLQNHMAR